MRKLDAMPTCLRRGRYDWDTIFDGGIYELTRGVDFMVSVKNVRTNAYVAAKSRGIKIQTSVTGENTLVIRAINP